MKNIKWKSTSVYLLLAVVLACGSPAFAETLPVITSQPSDATIDYGQSASLSITATGANLTYQWYQSISGGTYSIKLDGMTSSSYTTPTNLNQGVFYWVRVSNAAGDVDSATAAVTLNDSQPTITLQPAITISDRGAGMTIGTQPAAVSIDCDDSDRMRVYVRLRVAAAGPNLTYQWYQGLSGDTSTPVTNATSSMNTKRETYTLLNTPTITESTSFWVRAANGTYHVDSAAATITVTDNKLSETVGALRLVRPALLQYVPLYVESWLLFYEAEYNNPDDPSLGIDYVQPFEASPKVGRYGENKVTTADAKDPDSGLYSKSRRYKGASGREQYLRMVLTNGVYIENDVPFPIMGFDHLGPVADYMGFINIEEGDTIAANSDSLVIVDCWDERANINKEYDSTKPSDDADGVEWLQLVINKGLPSEATINCTRRQGAFRYATPPSGDLWGLFDGVLNLPEGAYSLNIRYESNDPVYDSVNDSYTYTPTGIITDGPRITITAGNAAVPPSIPADFVATPGDGYVRLQWAHDDSQVVESYKVYRAASPSGGSYSLLTTLAPNGFGTAGLNEYIDSTAVNSFAYDYVVQAVNSSSVESFLSDELTVTPGALAAGTDRTIFFNYTFSGGKALNWHFADLDRPSRTTYYGETTASGTVGALTSNHYFSIAVSALDNWDATGAQSEIAGGTFSTFLTGLEETSQGYIKTDGSGNMGINDEDVEKDASGVPIESVRFPVWIVQSDKSPNELDGTNEAIVFTVDTTGLGSGLVLQLKEIRLDNDTTADFLIYDVSENMLSQNDLNTATTSKTFTGTWSLEQGDKIIVGASGGNTFRCDNLTFKIVTGIASTN